MDRARVAPRPLPFHLLEEITDGFSEERKLGAGAYGSVYKGQHKNGEIIAIKKLHSMPKLNNQQFQKEYLNLATLQHQNIVRLVGYCHETRGEYIEFNGRTIFAENQHMALCFEYMCNGSLDNCLQDESSGHDWKTRYKIIKGICKGLKYLHEELNPPIYHLDLKPANILLDEQMNPKIADFGLSKFFGDERTRVSASAIGTIGYLPPEYINCSLVSNKLDVFSLGVIIIKTMTGHLGYSQSAEMPSEEFIDLVQEKWKNRIQGPSVDDIDSCAELVKTCIKIALNCVDADRHKRPNIGDIIRELDETEIMTQFSQAVTIDPGSTSLDEQDESGFLEVHPHQLRFLFFELNKAICPLLLSNSTEDNVAFRILSENHMEELSELSGVVPPRSTQTYWLVMKKQPPANTSEFSVTLESCIAHEDIADGDDQFLPEVLELTQGNKVHKVTLMAVTSERTRSGVTKVETLIFSLHLP
uniref:Protein kinase domain-containing protein n=2 Tax=Aegilops tauschii subsp. strangulata TaxID=200361 RepID=A0A453MVM6_AEGTS